jgi:WD40-like Beta Propeller Repeat
VNTLASPSPTRVLAFLAVGVTCIAAAGGYAWWATKQRAQVAATITRTERPLSALPDPGSAPYLLLRITGPGASHGRMALEALNASDGVRQVSTLNCDRVHAAAGRGICLEARRGAITTYHAHLFDRTLRTTATLDLAGAPSRTRLSADGTLAAFTVFVSGHSYSSPGFSTRTSIVDVASGRPLGDDLEKFAVVKDGLPFKASDFNFWGVTFTPDSKSFYATLQTNGQQWLVQGDIAAQRMTVIAPNVECPSLSPDGRRIAFKRRITPPPQSPQFGRVLWQLVVRELSDGKETTLSRETRNVDDQVEWIDNREIAYSLPDDATPAATNAWALAIDGSSAPRLLAPLAYSPAVVRQ